MVTLADGRDARMQKTPSDADLVARVVNREADALGDLFDRYSRVLLALIRRIVGGAGEAEEVLQEVFLQVWNQAERYDSSRSSVSNWLSLISRSRSIDCLRKARVKERTAQKAFEEDSRLDTSPEGPADVFFTERRRRIRGALGDLPVEQKAVIELAFFEGLTQTEIAERTSIPLGTVKTRTLLAMKKLRKALRDDLRELL